MNAIEEFEFWLGDCLDNPQSLENETWRIFTCLCARGNPHALAYYGQMQEEWRRSAIERGEITDTDSPINTVGSFDLEEVDLSVVPPDLEADYPQNWATIAGERKAFRKWQCETCSFRLEGSGLIQVHHIDRDKSNNEKINLQVLCAVCHGEKHRGPPTWPVGVRESDMLKIIAYHRSRQA